jgi:hypothetical protein
MFGLFKKIEPFTDSHLGLLVKSGDRWKGTISFGSYENVELQIADKGKAPEPSSLELAHQLRVHFSELRLQIENSLFEHYLPYQEVASLGELPEYTDPFPAIDSAKGVWIYVTPVYVLIEPLRGSPLAGPTIEIAFTVAWDEEHTVGARIQNWRIFELCGSV